jgi:HlyD family secretion protein
MRIKEKVMKLKKLKKRTWIIIGVVVVIAVVGLLGAVRRNSNGAARFEFAKVERGDIENTISSTGTLNAVGTVEVGTQVSGTIDKVYVDFNDQVRKNQILAVLDTILLATTVRDAEANLLKAQAQHDLSLTKYEDAQELYKNEFISELDFRTTKTEYESARATLLSSQATLDRAEANFKYAVIRSPINGTVINRNVESGQTVAASFSTPTLFVIAEDLSQMEIHAYVDESDIGQIKEEQSVRFTVDAYPDETFDGTVREIRLQPETIQNVVNYTVVVDAANDKGLLLPGMTATVDFLVEQRQNVLLISNTALRIQPTENMLVELRKTMTEKMAAVPDSIRESREKEMKEMRQELGLPEPGSMNQESPEEVAMLWYFDDESKLSMMPIRTGATNGKHTEIMHGRGIEEGMEFISGIGKQDELENTEQQTGRPPGPPRLF